MTAPIPEHVWVRMYRREARAEQNGKCCYCRWPLSDEDATADHVVARKNGGTTKRANIKAACSECNNAKGFLNVQTFNRLIRNPPEGASIGIWFAHFRLRLRLSVERVHREMERLCK